MISIMRRILSQGIETTDISIRKNLILLFQDDKQSDIIYVMKIEKCLVKKLKSLIELYIYNIG